MDITKFQFKRVNPFQGLVVDADTWRDAHNYHREQQKLHVLAFHKTGIVSGLEISAGNPPDSSVNISPGMAIDPDGNVIIVSQKQRYRLQTRQDKAVIYLTVQFREVPGEPYQPPEGGQPTRILEAYRIQESDHLPSEAYIELARIDMDPAQPNFKDAANPLSPANNEIDLRYRQNALQTPQGPAPDKVVTNIAAPRIPVEAARPAPKETMLVGYAVLGEASNGIHASGLKNLAREFSRQEDVTLEIEDQVDLKKSLSRYSLLYLVGNGRFELSAEQQSALSNYLQTGGVVFGDGCSAHSGGTEGKGAREFGLSFNRFASQLNRKLEMVKRGHLLLMTDYVFSEVPPGCEPAMLLEGGNMIYSGSDYGCAWEGGHADEPLSREVIRSALEIGGNIVAYARKTRKK
jgi:hypothetical protein